MKEVNRLLEELKKANPVRRMLLAEQLVPLIVEILQSLDDRLKAVENAPRQA
jgi:hypothetical protein